ncbi:MIP/aquaporin family protein [Urechidicola croceus]|uniref:Aquaporin n=1 Tax=Urechidicola croceus TaxID=1850246 RepID=A0A1D8P504_9FLAO|nr:MIP family channel protein [Urechidicola croceus]AOW19636.1 aquaporin [Urechidicola croceus]
MKKYLSEFIGTYILIFFGTGAMIVDSINPNIGVFGIAVAWGVVVMAMIYAFGESSGAHINPAVTIGFAVAGRFDKNEVIPYIIAQILGAITASFTLKLLFPNQELYGNTIPSGSWIQSFILEFIMTFVLMLVIMKVSTGSKEVGTMAAVAIGGIILIEALVFGPISNASMNPARSLAPALASGNFTHLWIYIVAPVLGAIVGIFICPFIGDKKDDCC